MVVGVDDLLPEVAMEHGLHAEVVFVMEHDLHAQLAMQLV